MLQRFLLIWLTFSSAVAFYWPQWFPSAGDPFAGPYRWADSHNMPYLSLLIALTMFAIGSLLPRDEIRDVFQNWPTVLGGTAIQYTAMPLLAYAMGRLFRLDEDMMIGVVMVGCVPGAMASNVLTLAARGNVSYSVSLTTAATLLSPAVVPLALWLTLGETHKLDPLQVGLDLLATVVGPVVAGHLLSRSFARFERTMRTCGPVMANLTILWIIAVVVGLNRDELSVVTVRVLSALLIVNLLGYAAGYFGGRVLRLPDPMRRALTLEVGMQNAGLGTFLALRMFPDNLSRAIPTAVYTFGCMLTGTILAQIWALREKTKPIVATEEA